MNSYFDSKGNKYTQSQIDYRIRKAGRIMTESQRMDFGRNYCEECGINDNQGIPIDVAHIISRKKAKEMRKVELSWDLSNLRVLCRNCHNKLDRTEIQFT